MPIFAKAGGSFTPAPAGTHCAVCVDVVDHGLIEVTYQGKTRQQYSKRWHAPHISGSLNGMQRLTGRWNLNGKRQCKARAEAV